MNNYDEILNLFFLGRQKKKKQIILINTARNFVDYLNSLKYRNNGKSPKVPNFIVSKEGKITQCIPEVAYSGLFSNQNINRNSIVIALENLGWLEKKPLSNSYLNWIGDIYKGEVVEKKWRDYFFWQPYTEKQLISCSLLCKKLMNDFNIENKCIGHNVKMDGVERFEGVVTRSNFDTHYTDLTPAFNFEFFLKQLENEQLV
jgi:N-acetyl-anhydromuramyl-L-alanine amidase AmpD